MKLEEGKVVKHPKADWGYGVVLEDSDGKTVEVGFEKVGVKTLSLKHIELLVVDSTEVSKTQAEKMAAKFFIYSGEFFIDIFNDVKTKYPEHLVIIENGCYYEVLEQDAEYFSDKYEWKIYERQVGIPMTGFPVEFKWIWKKLKECDRPYVIVSQLPTQKGDEIQRSISEVFSGNPAGHPQNAD